MEPPDAFATALARPLTSPGFARAYRYTNREYLVVTYRASRAPLAEAVPEPPLTFDEPLVRCEFMRMQSSTGLARYLGAAQWPSRARAISPP